jgi:hypothetical protein
MAYSGSILAAILPQRYEKEIIQRNNLAKIEKIQRNKSAKIKIIQRNAYRQ